MWVQNGGFTIYLVVVYEIFNKILKFKMAEQKGILFISKFKIIQFKVKNLVLSMLKITKYFSKSEISK